MIGMVSLAASLGGDIRKIEQEFGNVEMIYFPPHNMLHCIGDVDRIEVVRGSGTFTDERYTFNFLVIIRIVKNKSILLYKYFFSCTR